MKRPPVPNVQTGTNGNKPTGLAQSPNTPSKRPPSATTPTANTGFGGAASNNVRAPVRRASQRPGDPASKTNRPTKAGEAGPLLQRPPEPFVRTSEYILNKYAKRPPSLIVHLHPNGFRFDQQDGSFPYQSQMKVVLEYIKQQTIPHDMADELLRSGTHFYEGCLIVQVRDHRHAAATKERVSKDDQKENNQPFSMHKHSKFLVPSPYVPYPLPKQISPERSDATSDNSRGGTSTESLQKQTEKDSDSRASAEEDRVFTTVLFPGLSNLNTELLDFAAWADNVSYQKTKRNAINQRGAGPQPVTGLPPAKRQKFLSDVTKLQEVEAKVISALAPPLYLDPVDGMDQAQELLKKLRDPRFNEEPPAPKSRKRTIAELAADEALAAEEQRFMLIMDERLQPSASGTAAADTDTGGATFEPRFERFKAIEDIRRQHQERQREEAEAKVHAHAHAQAEKEKLMRERQAQDLERQNQARQQQAQARAQQGMHGAQHPHGHLSAVNASVAGASQAFTAPQAHQGSPAMRNMTPHSASSPVNAHAMAASRSTQGGIPMAVSNSRQGSGSPPRPGSAIQHGHPLNMGPQQPPSRNGTPHIPGSTPRMQNATPTMHNVANTPRMGQGSPAMTGVAANPVSAQTMMNTPQNNGRPVTHAQFAAFQQQQQQQQQNAARHQMLQQQRQQAIARGQGSPPTMQMSPNLSTAQQQQQMVARAQQQTQMRAANSGQEAFRNQLHNVNNAQMAGGHPAGAMALPGNSVQQQQQSFGQQMHAGSPQATAANAALNRYAQQFFNQMKAQLINSGQPITEQTSKHLQMQAVQKAREALRNAARQNQIQQQRFQQQQQQMMNAMPNGNTMGMNGMS